MAARSQTLQERLDCAISYSVEFDLVARAAATTIAESARVATSMIALRAHTIQPWPSDDTLSSTIQVR